MKKTGLICLWAIGLLLAFTACNDKPEEKKEETAAATPKYKEENVSYKLDTVTMNGYVVYDESTYKKRPAVLVVHEWWGLNDYPKMRAKQLAEMGYIAFAVDMYGNGKTADNPTDAGKMSTPFYMNPQMAKDRFDAALRKIKEYAVTDTNNIAAIGYCFGGGVLLNNARLGENLNGVVSFHGGLNGTPPKKDLLKAKILVCHGEADSFVPKAEVDKFKKQMDSIGADYTFKGYPGATHAFTNPNSTENGKKFSLPIAYNAAADSASWNDMKVFFGKIFK
jgi:dienelactone hydrolase